MHLSDKFSNNTIQFTSNFLNSSEKDITTIDNESRFGFHIDEIKTICEPKYNMVGELKRNFKKSKSVFSQLNKLEETKQYNEYNKKPVNTENIYKDKQFQDLMLIDDYDFNTLEYGFDKCDDEGNVPHDKYNNEDDEYSGLGEKSTLNKRERYNTCYNKEDMYKPKPISNNLDISTNSLKTNYKKQQGLDLVINFKNLNLDYGINKNDATIGDMYKREGKFLMAAFYYLKAYKFRKAAEIFIEQKEYKCALFCAIAGKESDYIEDILFNIDNLKANVYNLQDIQNAIFIYKFADGRYTLSNYGSNLIHNLLCGRPDHIIKFSLGEDVLSHIWS